jgi:signal transduction histidine kinase
MRSIRSRLVLGATLVALVPLAIAILLLSQRIEAMVRAQAAERLRTTLGAMQAQMAADAERTAEKIRILARDPQLKRLYLVRAGGDRDLVDLLAERRFLLGLDLLQVVDAHGALIAESSTPPVGHPVGLAGVDGLSFVALEGAPGLVMVATAQVRYDAAVVGSVRGGLVLGPDLLARLRRGSGVDLGLTDAHGLGVASTLGDHGGDVPAPRPGVTRVKVAGQSYLSQSLPLEVAAAPYPSITGLVSTGAADRTIASLQWASALLGLLGLALAVVLGYLWSSQISRPVERLAMFSRRLAQGEWDEPLTLHSVRELETLVAALDRMRTELKTYRDRLVVSERQAAWGQMARKVAHEIKNPLTPIAVSVADLKRSYQMGRDDFPQILDQAARTITEEVDALKRLLQEFSDFARFPAPRLAPCLLSSLFADLESLYGRDVAEGRLVLSRPDRDVTLVADAGQMRQALVNLIKNGLEASEDGGRVTVAAVVERDALVLTVSDSGLGLTAEQRANLFVPGFTTKTHGSGLGLTIVERIVSEHQGSIIAEDGARGGTTFRIQLPLPSSNAAAGGARGT